MVYCANQNIPVAKRQFHNVLNTLVQEPRHRTEAILVRPDKVSNLDGQHRLVAGARPNKRVASYATGPGRVHQHVEPSVDRSDGSGLQRREVGLDQLIDPASVREHLEQQRTAFD